MKKLILFCMLAALLLALAAPASADVIWEPVDNAFFQKHREDFQVHQTSYYVNDPSGVCTLYRSPGGAEGGTLENGQVFSAYYLYTAEDGAQWGMSIDEQYVPMACLLNVYDQEFLEEYAGSIQKEAPANVRTKLAEGETFLWWSYPHGVWHAEENRYGADCNLTEQATEFYQDAQGLWWGYISYWMGRQEAWVCLSQPNAPELAEPERYTGPRYFGENPDPVPEKVMQSVPKSSWKNTLVIALPCAAVVLAGGLLLLWPRKKK